MTKKIKINDKQTGSIFILQKPYTYKSRKNFFYGSFREASVNYIQPARTQIIAQENRKEDNWTLNYRA